MKFLQTVAAFDKRASNVIVAVVASGKRTSNVIVAAVAFGKRAGNVQQLRRSLLSPLSVP